MRIITSIDTDSTPIKESLAKWGICAEHNFSHYLCTQTRENSLRFLSFEKKMGVLLSEEKNGAWHLFPMGILAPKEMRLRLFLSALRYVLLTKKAKKISIEVDEGFRAQILSSLSLSKKFTALRTNYILYWPVFEMGKFEHKMAGKRWKKMRNILNRFKKQHTIKIVDSKTVPKDKLNRIISQWLRKRTHSDTVDDAYYYNIVSSNFKGLDLAKTLYIDGNPCTITAGWKIPNSRGHYYSAIGIYDYSIKCMGEFVNLTDLLLLKKKGFKVVDFGGSSEALLNFKNKFRPHYLYKTYCFSIVRK